MRKSSKNLFVIAILISGFLHFGSLFNLSWLRDSDLFKRKHTKKTETIKVNIVSKEPNKKQIVEVRQKKTEPPKDAKFQSFDNHQTKKETKVAADKLQNNKGDAGNAKTIHIAKNVGAQKKSATAERAEQLLDGDIVVGKKAKIKEFNETFLPKADDLGGQIKAGYQAYVEDEIALGERIDLNTTEHRYMGYLSSMRKAIQLVWIYPRAAAQRGMQGVVEVEFVVNKDGTVKRIQVLKTSGYKVLDDAVVEALNLASPFSPLPDGFGKKKIRIAHSFRYILNSGYVSH